MEASNSESITSLDFLKRFLYSGVGTNLFTGRFIKEPNRWPNFFNDGYLTNWIDSAELATVINTAHNSFYLVNRETIFIVFARILNSTAVTALQKSRARDLLLKYMISDKDFLTFIKVYSKLYPQERRKNKKKFPTTLKKIARKWYKEKNAVELATMISKRLSYHKWTHKNVFKLCHLKCADDAKERVVKYVLYGLLHEHSEENEVNNILRKHHELRKSTAQLRSVNLVNECKGNGRQINTILNRDVLVLRTIFQETSPRKVLRKLRKFKKLKLLDELDFIQRLRGILTTTENIRQSRLHPLEVFIYKKIFEVWLHRHSEDNTEPVPMECDDDGTAPLLQMLKVDIDRCLRSSYSNCANNGLNILITVDVTDGMQKHCHGTKIKTIETTAAIIKYFQETEKNVTAAIFAEDTIKEIMFNERLHSGDDDSADGNLARTYSTKMSLEQPTPGCSRASMSSKQELLDLLQPAYIDEPNFDDKLSFIIPTSPIKWALQKNIHFDVFINIMASDWKERIPAPDQDNPKITNIHGALRKYNETLKINSRIVRLFLGGPIGGVPLRTKKEGKKNIFTINGFSPEVPKVLDAFCVGLFS